MPLFGSKAGPDLTQAVACPRDGRALTRLDREGVAVDRCDGCSGHWFDHGELKRVAHDKELAQLAERVRRFASPSAFACPRCGGACATSHIGDVEVDTCTLCHGVWLDAGELDEAKRQVETNRVLALASPGFRSFLVRL